MKQYIICVGDNDYLKDLFMNTTRNQLYALRFTDLPKAQRIAAVAEKYLNKPILVRDFNICNPQEILETILDKIGPLLAPWAADIGIDWKKNKILIFHPDGRKTYELTLTTKYAD